MSQHSLLVLAHHDDEYFFLPFLDSFLREGNKLTVIYTTKDNLDGKRKKESFSFFSNYPFQNLNYLFLGELEEVDDGSGHRSTSQIYERAIVEIQKQNLSFDGVLGLAWEGGHHDHDSAHLIAVALAKKLNISSLKFFHLYNSFGLRRPFFRVAFPFAKNEGYSSIRLSKILVCSYLLKILGFPSQVKTFIGLAPGLFWSWFFKGTCFYKTRIETNYLKPPHEGELLYQRMFNVSFDEFKEMNEGFVTKYLS